MFEASLPGRERPECSDLDAAEYNAFAYGLLGQKRTSEALELFELVCWARPQSANAQDSLADAYLAVGKIEKARTVLKRALNLAPRDTTIGQPSFIAEVKDRLDRLK